MSNRLRKMPPEEELETELIIGPGVIIRIDALIQSALSVEFEQQETTPHQTWAHDTYRQIVFRLPFAQDTFFMECTIGTDTFNAILNCVLDSFEMNADDENLFKSKVVEKDKETN